MQKTTNLSDMDNSALSRWSDLRRQEMHGKSSASLASKMQQTRHGPSPRRVRLLFHTLFDGSAFTLVGSQHAKNIARAQLFPTIERIRLHRAICHINGAQRAARNVRIGAGKNALAAALHIVGARIVSGVPYQTRRLNHEHAAPRREHLKGFAFEETITTHHDCPICLRGRCGQLIDKREAHAPLLFRIGVRRDCLATRSDSRLRPRLNLGSVATGRIRLVGNNGLRERARDIARGLARRWR